MFKKLVFFVAMLAVLCIPSTVAAFDVVSSVDLGMLAQNGTNPIFAYAIGAKVPTVNKDTYTLSTIVTYFYTDRVYSAENVEEIEVIRVLALYERNVYKDVYIGLGSGLWTFINSDGSNSDYISFCGKTGITAFGLDIAIGCDIVHANKAPDLYFPHVSISILTF
jgi:hypothetical protein